MTFDANGEVQCPRPTKDYLPCCWQAGEIIRSRCGDIPADQCERRVEEARINYARAGVAGHVTLPGTEIEEWKDCGQCRDCFNPSFNMRPGNSAQYVLALGNFDKPGEPARFHFGFIASSDNHTARPGTGYKEYDRRMMTEAAGAGRRRHAAPRPRRRAGADGGVRAIRSSTRPSCRASSWSTSSARRPSS